MIKVTQLPSGTTLWLLNAKTLKLKAGVVVANEAHKGHGIDMHFITFSLFKYRVIETTFCAAVNPERKESGYYPSVQFKGSSAVFFLFTSELKAREFLKEVAIPMAERQTTWECEEAQKQHTKLLDKLTALSNFALKEEKKIEKLKANEKK